MTTKEDIQKLHAERGDFRDLPLTIPGKGHWLWGLRMRMYPHGFNANYKKETKTNNTVVNNA